MSGLVRYILTDQVFVVRLGLTVQGHVLCNNKMYANIMVLLLPLLRGHVFTLISLSLNIFLLLQTRNFMDFYKLAMNDHNRSLSSEFDFERIQ